MEVTNFEFTPAPPIASILIPSSGGKLSGTTYLDASAPHATSVQFRLFGGRYGFLAPVVRPATLTLYGWLCSWNSRTVPNGSYVLVAGFQLRRKFVQSWRQYLGEQFRPVT